ncbi:MAG: hypothetical protein K9N23_16510 [Akkermansiaceae bacterium]|nr:hypothetical protein [Akkermansiaceae bacterium]
MCKSGFHEEANSYLVCDGGSNWEKFSVQVLILPLSVSIRGKKNTASA